MSEEQIGLLAPEAIHTHPYLALWIGAAFVAGLGVDIWLLARIPALRAALAARAPAMHRTVWSWREALALCLAALLLNQFAFLVIHAVERFSGSTSSSLSLALLLQTAWVPLCILVLVRAMILHHNTTWTAAFELNPHHPTRKLAHAVPLLLAMLPPLALTAGLAQFVLTRLHIPFDRQFVVNILIDPSQPVWLRIYLCGAAIVVAPVVEEITFRGILLPSLARNGRWVLAAGVTAFLFAGAHFNLASALPLFVLALGLSFAYITSGSLWVPIMMHSLFNTLSLGLLLLAR